MTYKAPMTSLNSVSTEQLKQAVQIKEEIARLEKRLNAILGGQGQTQAAAPSKATAGKGRRPMSAAGRAKIAAAAKARWAKIKGGAAKAAANSSTKAAKPQAGKKKGGLTPEGRAKLAAAMKARWA